MKSGFVYSFRFAIIAMLFLPWFSCRQQGFEEPVVDKYTYLFPEQLFKPGIVSTGLQEHSGFDIAPNGKLAFWTISLNGHKIILESKLINDEWQVSNVASFSGQYRDEYHFFTPDGQSVYFNSYRPDKLGEAVPKKFSHFVVNKTAEGWSNPIKHNMWHPDLWSYSMDKDQNVVGWASLDSSKTDADIYIQRFDDQGYSEPEKLPEAINSNAIEYCPEISMDGNLLFFCRMGLGKEDGIYLSKKVDGDWSVALRLSEIVNRGYAERFPKYDEAHKILYFNRQVFKYEGSSMESLTMERIQNIVISKPQNGSGDIYFVEYESLTDEGVD